MTAHRPDDEVLSALLDAEPVGQDAAHVAACADCQHRLTELRAAARLAATPPPHVAGHVREAAVARAVEASTIEHNEGRLAAIHPLRRRTKAAPSPLRRRVGPLPAAAALVAVVVAAGLMLNLTTGGGGREIGDDSSKVALSPSPTANRTSGAAASDGGIGTGDSDEAGLGEAEVAPSGDSALSAAPSAQRAASGGSAQAIADGGDLGAVDHVEEITRRAEDDLAGAHKAGDERPCRAVAVAAGRVHWQAGVVYRGTEAVAYRLTDGSGQRVTQVWSAADCSSIARQAV